MNPKEMLSKLFQQYRKQGYTVIDATRKAIADMRLYQMQVSLRSI